MSGEWEEVLINNPFVTTSQELLERLAEPMARAKADGVKVVIVSWPSVKADLIKKGLDGASILGTSVEYVAAALRPGANGQGAHTMLSDECCGT